MDCETYKKNVNSNLEKIRDTNKEEYNVNMGEEQVYPSYKEIDCHKRKKKKEQEETQEINSKNKENQEKKERKWNRF